MIHEKRFYLKIRKAKVRWGCACCVPDAAKLDKVRIGKKREKEFFTKLIRQELNGE